MSLRILLLLTVLLLPGGSAWAAEIYGQLWGASREVPVGAVVTSSCSDPVTVDQYGRYRLTGLPLQTTCALIIEYKDLQSNPANIYTATNRNSANFMLKVAAGRLLLIRR